MNLSVVCREFGEAGSSGHLRLADAKEHEQQRHGASCRDRHLRITTVGGRISHGLSCGGLCSGGAILEHADERWNASGLDALALVRNDLVEGRERRGSFFLHLGAARLQQRHDRTDAAFCHNRCLVLLAVAANRCQCASCSGLRVGGAVSKQSHQRTDGTRLE